MDTSTPSNQQSESTGSASEGRSMRSRSAANTPAEKGQPPQASRKLYVTNSLHNLIYVAGVLCWKFKLFFGHFNLKMISEPEFSPDILSDDAGACRETFSIIVRHD